MSAVLVLTAGTGYFVAQEFAYVAADRLALAREAEAGDRRAARAVQVLGRLSFMLSGAQLGITVTGLVVGFLAEPPVSGLAISHELDPLLAKLGLPAGLNYGIAFALAMVVVVFLHMVVGEMAPKSWAIAHPERSAMLLTPPFRAVVRAVRRCSPSSTRSATRSCGCARSPRATNSPRCTTASNSPTWSRSRGGSA